MDRKQSVMMAVMTRKVRWKHEVGENGGILERRSCIGIGSRKEDLCEKSQKYQKFKSIESLPHERIMNDYSFLVSGTFLYFSFLHFPDSLEWDF